MVLASGAAAAGAAGCASHHPKPAALRLERTDLVLLAHTLQRLKGPATAEVGAARVVWPTLAGGVPPRASPALRRGVAAATRRARALGLPGFVTTEGGLTGPAAKLGGMLKAYVVLTQRGWEHLAVTPPVGAARPASTPSAGSPSVAHLLRANSGLYIYSVYDGHYDLSLIGKAIQGAYRALGGAPAFGAALTPGQVAALARVYSIASTRLAPHPPPSVTV
ncbi:MAG TPA: hypothetical protein VNY52_13200 [Solirubrobacteraceae bacterium]|nr:hypothetical protein [Solirubrobacteraceae bacterium]